MDLWMDVDTALSEVPVNIAALIDDTDFKTREESVVYNQAGMDLVWNFVTTAGAMTQTAVTPTTAGDYDWTNQGNGMYSIEIPASGGASINNDTEGFGWFTGYATGILPWRGPIVGFRAAGLNNVLIDSAYSATRGLSGTALPDAAADAAGGLIISDAGGLDIDTTDSNVSAILADTGTDGVVLASTATSAQLVDDVWDELLTGATHNTATSAGRRLRELADLLVITSGTAQAGAAGSITLAAGESATDDLHEHQIIVIVAGTGVGQSRAINAYNGTTKVATIVPNWVTTPDATSQYEIFADTEKHVYEVHTDGISNNSIADDAISASKFATDAIGADALAASAIDEILDEQIGDGTTTMRESLRVFLSILAGKVSGGGTDTITFRDLADTKNVQVATVDANGNRAAVTVVP
jgi:hypothetical protein